MSIIEETHDNAAQLLRAGELAQLMGEDLVFYKDDDGYRLTGVITDGDSIYRFGAQVGYLTRRERENGN